MNHEIYSEICKYSPVGIVMLNENMELVDVNEYMFSIFAMKKQDFKGKKFGNLFGCSVVAETGQICGQEENCNGCELMDGISAAMLTNAKIRGARASQSFLIGSANTLKWFRFSAISVREGQEKFGVASFIDITREKQYEELLKNEMALDLAGGTVNKHNLINILMDLEKYAPTYTTVSVGIIDMDNFKDINDNYGHAKGDEVLNSFSRIARQNIRKQDIIGRFSGEEFMFVFPGVNLKYAAKIIKRIHNELSEKFSAQDINGVSFSAGFTELSADELDSYTKEEIIDTVDGYLCQAKKAGKRLFVSGDLTMAL